MHDDTALIIGRAARVLSERVLPAVHAVSVPLTVAACDLPGEPVPVADALGLVYLPHKVGTDWGPSWGTTWFRLRGEVPPAWAGRRVEAVIDLGFDPDRTGFECEGLVHRADGSPVKSVNPRNRWVLVADAATPGQPVELFVEAAANPVIMDGRSFRPTAEGDPLTASDRPRYTTRRMELAVFETDVFELALDLRTLLELQEELSTGPRRLQILQAVEDALDVLDLQDVAGTAAAARVELAGVLAAPAHASAHRISAIGHAHIDSAWLWPVRETVRKVARTAASVTELIDASEDFRYGMSSAQQYAWIKEHRPEVYARVRAAVAAGRFLPLGGMWVESDTVMPTGEAIVRQFSQGQRFFESEFGIRCRGVWLPDSFGYSPALPQLIRRAGFEWFFTQKISWNQTNRFPHHTFAWEGIDGSRVFTHFPPMDTYNSQLSGAEVATAARQFREHRRANSSLAPVGWGDGGGGPTREMLGAAARLADLEGSPRVRWEDPDDFFARARAEYPDPPVWVGELYLELHRATLTTQHRTKQGNRRSEQLLLEAELWCATAATRTDFAYPHDALDRLWQQVLLAQFHDILPGTAIAWVHREAVALHAQVAGELAGIIGAALTALTGPGDRELLANPAAVPVRGLAAGAVGGASADGPAVGLAERPGGGVVVTNEQVRVEIDAAGLIVSAVDLASGREAIAPGRAGNLLQLHQDLPHAWDAWDVDRSYANRAVDLRELQELSSRVGGDGVATVVVRRAFSASRIEQRLSLAPGERVLRIEQTVDWHETEKFLKLSFPLDVRAEHTAAETQFGAVRRVTHTNTSWEAARFETSMHRFVLAEEPGFGVAVINDSSYGYDVSRDAVDGRVSTTVRISLLRAPRFPDPGTDQGEQTHRLGLVVGTDLAGATAAGITLNAPTRRVIGGHGVDPLVTVGGGALLSCVKAADDRSGDLIVRIYEPAGRRVQAAVSVAGPFGAPREVTLLEEPVAGAGPVPAGADGSARPALQAFQVCTLRYPRRR